MKLDESIELKNQQTNNEINTNKNMNNININEMRSCMNEILANETSKDCMYEVLRMEGFLPESIEEGETYENIYEQMISDDEIMLEMFNACRMNESNCGIQVNEVIKNYISEKLHGNQTKIDADNDGKITAKDFEILRKSDVKEGNHSEGTHYKKLIDQICLDLEAIKNNINDTDDLAPWIQDKIAVMNHSADAIRTYLVSGDEVNLSEEFKAFKGKNVDAENKSNSNKENDEAIKSAEKSQETENEKVDNLKNQKHGLNDIETEIKDMSHGFRNTLDLDYATGLSKEDKDRILNLASGLAPEDHANVDHDSEAGEKLINAAKLRNKNKINKNDYSSAHDVTSIEDREIYQKTTAVNEELNRIKNIFKYETELVSENKKNKLNENDLLIKSISKK